jgi:hypothetical protein
MKMATLKNSTSKSKDTVVLAVITIATSTPRTYCLTLLNSYNTQKFPTTTLKASSWTRCTLASVTDVWAKALLSHSTIIATAFVSNATEVSIWSRKKP